jgi:hypothetical protein
LCEMQGYGKIPAKTQVTGALHFLWRYWPAGQEFMTTVTVSLRTALLIARHRKKAVPRWKRWRLRNPEKDKEQRKAYYWRNRDKIAANSRIRYRNRKGANAGDLNEP